MKKFFLSLLLVAISMISLAQQKIQLSSANKAECVKSDMKSLKASFSFATIEAEDMETKGGQFSWLNMANTVIGGNEGDPQIPVINELIAVPFGANPRIEVKSYSSTDYRLADYGIKTVMPRQLPVRKNQKLEDVPFIMNEAAYQSNRGFRSTPMAVVNVEGFMRGVQLGKMTIEPVSYDPVNNILRVFNDIEVEVSFDGADAVATEKMLVDTYSPYFEIAYKQLFNGRAIMDIYTSHPDLYNTPVKMLVVTTSTYANSTAFQNWLTWKKQKGIYVDVQTVANSASASTIKNLIYSRYNANHPSFLVLVGDETVVTHYSLWDYDSSYGNAATDLEYASVDGDVYHDMYMSRMPVSSTTELGNLVNKILTYEKYTMSDPSYLNETLLIAGWDSYWTNVIGKPTIQYANNNYFNSAHGITPHVFITTASGQRTCYNYINNVGFINYTAHGDIQKWADPSFTNTNVNSLTNNDKYFWAMGNCCLTANFKNAQNNQTCFGEAMIRAANKGAWGYIGSVPESIWYEDYYFGVGAFNAGTSGSVPSVNGTTKGAYDALFDETSFNCLNSVPFIGNLAVSYAHSKNYTTGVSEEYYWRAYQCFGDGSVMPYLKVPAANNVSHTGVLPIGANSYTVSADAGSYVSITVNNEIIGVAAVPNNSTSVSVPVTAQSVPGTAMIVVTRNQRQPYIGSINIVGGQQYNITVNQPQHGTISAPTQAYANSTVTLTATPETGYCLSSWTVKMGNTTIPVTNNQFTMPEGHVTVTATFVPGLAVTLASVMHGTISADTEYALQGNTINLTATPATGYVFDSWVVYKTGDVNTTVTVNGNSFTMPNYPVTVSAIFNGMVTNDVTIGSGNSTNDYLPTHSYYNYTLTQQIYKPSEVGSSGTITKVAFKVSNSKSASRSIDIYMSHTSTSTFSSTSSWIAQSTAYRVFSGSVNFNASGWTTITLDTPFEYNGTSNLLLTVDDNTGDYVSSSSNSPKFYVYSTSGYTSLGKYNDDTDYNPASMSTSGTRAQTNNQIMLTKVVPSTNGYLSVSPTSLSDFTAVAGGAPSNPQSFSVVGSNLQANLTVTAPTGYQVCATQNGTYNSTLTLTPSNGSLRANVFVRLGTNANPGEYNGNLTLASGTATASVNLSGTVIPGNVKYPVTVAANPTAGGSVTGAGEYSYNTSVTVTATANEGYTFTNWTLNGDVVSTNASYSFNVTGAADFVANFQINSYQVTASPNPIAYGTVAIAGIDNGEPSVLSFDFENGFQGWTVLQGTNGDSPNNWMHNTDYTGYDYSSGNGHNASDGFILSESFIVDDNIAVHPDNYLVSPQIVLGGSISFWAADASDDYGDEHFAVAVSTNGNANASDFATVQEWTLHAEKTGGTRSLDNGTWYEYTADLSAFVGFGYVAIHHFNCYEQWILCIDDVTIVEGEPFAAVSSFDHGQTCTITATPNDGYSFVNWTENGAVVSSDASYSFTVTADRDLVANFSQEMPSQTISLSQGTNWWSTNFNITLDQLKDAIASALGNSGTATIKSQSGSINYKNGVWRPADMPFDIRQMFIIEVSSDCEITLSGSQVSPADYPITIHNGINWIGFLHNQSMSLSDAFGSFPVDGDMVKSNIGSATYRNGNWRNGFDLEPGQGYIYQSNYQDDRTFTFGSNK